MLLVEWERGVYKQYLNELYLNELVKTVFD